MWVDMDPKQTSKWDVSCSDIKKTSFPVRNVFCTGLLTFCRFGVVYKIVSKERETLLLDTQQEELSNWMIFVRPAEKKAEQNLVAFQYKGDIYFATIKVCMISVVLWYGMSRCMVLSYVH